jgi:hypothetical protein
VHPVCHQGRVRQASPPRAQYGLPTRPVRSPSKRVLGFVLIVITVRLWVGKQKAVVVLQEEKIGESVHCRLHGHHQEAPAMTTKEFKFPCSCGSSKPRFLGSRFTKFISKININSNWLLHILSTSLLFHFGDFSFSSGQVYATSILLR